MPIVDLELQLKFLQQLEGALSDAMVKYEDADVSKKNELEYMKREVDRAQAVVANKIAVTKKEESSFKRTADYAPKRQARQYKEARV